MIIRRILTIGLCAAITAYTLSYFGRHNRLYTPFKGHTAAAIAVPAVYRSLRPHYPFSIVPGGIYSPAELQADLSKDPLVREHYSDFDARDAHLVTLTEDRYQYVSYKLKGEVFWTKKKLRIPKGEVLLSDGRSYARTRCGNRLSDIRRGKTTPFEPSESILSMPPYHPPAGTVEIADAPPPVEFSQEFPMLPFEGPQPSPFLPTGTPMSIPAPFTPATPFAPLTPSSTPGGFVPGGPTVPTTPNTPTTPTTPTTPSEVPEPSTISLLGLAFIGSAGILAWFKRRRVDLPAKASV